MTGVDFDYLRVGDIVSIKRGKNEGRECIVLYIDTEDRCVLVRSLDNKPFDDRGNYNRRLKLTGWRELDAIP